MILTYKRCQKKNSRQLCKCINSSCIALKFHQIGMKKFNHGNLNRSFLNCIIFQYQEISQVFYCQIYSGSPSTVFYAMENTEHYLYVLDCSVLVLPNYDSAAKSELIRL